MTRFEVWFFFHLLSPLKKLSCLLKSAGWKFFHHLPVRVVAFVSECIFFLSNKRNTHTHTHTHTQRNKKIKKLKKIEKQKKPKKKRRNKDLLLLLTISAENVMGYDDSFDNLFCVLLIYMISQKRERVLKSNKLWKEFVYICVLFVQDGNQVILMQ